MRSGAGTSAVDLPSGESLRPPLAWLATRSGGDRQAKRGDDVREEEEERRARKTRLPRASLPPPLVRVAMGMGMGSGWARPLGRAGLVVRSGRAGPGACVVEDWIHHPTGSAVWLVGSVRCGAVVAFARTTQARNGLGRGQEERTRSVHLPTRLGTLTVNARSIGPRTTNARRHLVARPKLLPRAS